MANTPKKGTFAFELSKPTKRGTMLKQGALHRAFKYRYFVLYPGFLVYYDTETKWKVDLAKGETLGNRIGAIKLKNGTVNAARDAPKGCKFGLIVHAPDPVNKRQSYLLNALSKVDRDDWISAVKTAIPTSKSPQANRKGVKPEEKPTPRPPPVARQDTAAAAALLDSEDREEEKETETSFDNHLNIRHNTADSAALLDSHEVAQEDTEMEAEQITALDDEIISKALGQKENGRNDSSDEDTAGQPQTPPTSDVIVNGHANSPTEIPLDTEQKVESSMNIEGKVEVVTSVKVQAGNGEHSVEGEGESKSEGEEEEEVEKRRRTSTEVAIAEVKTALTVTMIRDNTTEVPDSDTESDDDSAEDTACVDPPASDDLTSEPSEDVPPTSDPPESCSDLPPEPTTPSTPSTPAITIDKVPTLRRSEGPEDTMNPEEEEAVTQVLQTKGKERRTSASASAPFIEKRGFLYKEGGQRKTWKLRYFVLQPGMFTYYKTNSGTKPLGEVKLKNLQVRYPTANERKQSFQFVVHTESSWNKRNNYVMAAQSNAEMKHWVTAFKLAGQKNTTPSASPPGSSEDETTPTT